MPPEFQALKAEATALLAEFNQVHGAEIQATSTILNGVRDYLFASVLLALAVELFTNKKNKS